MAFLIVGTGAYLFAIFTFIVQGKRLFLHFAVALLFLLQLALTVIYRVVMRGGIWEIIFAVAFSAFYIVGHLVTLRPQKTSFLLLAVWVMCGVLALSEQLFFGWIVFEINAVSRIAIIIGIVAYFLNMIGKFNNIVGYIFIGILFIVTMLFAWGMAFGGDIIVLAMPLAITFCSLLLTGGIVFVAASKKGDRFVLGKTETEIGEPSIPMGERLKALAVLQRVKEAGQMTEEEFEAQKKIILGDK